MFFKSPSQEMIKQLKKRMYSSHRIICHDQVTNRFFMLDNDRQACERCKTVNQIINHYGVITYKEYAKCLGIFESYLFSDTDQVAVTGQLLTYNIEDCKGVIIYNFYFIS